MKYLTVDEMSTLAHKDSMYYNYDEWFSRFQGEINREIPSVVGFWFAWYAFHPETRIFSAK